MGRYHTDGETFWRVFMIGEALDDFDDGLHALAAHSRGDTTPVPEGVLDRVE